MMIVALLILVSLGFAAVVWILLNEQRVNKTLSRKISVHDESQRKTKEDAGQIKVESEKLNVQIQELLKTNEQLIQAVGQKDAVIQKYQTAAINFIADRFDQTKLGEIMSPRVISIQVDAPFSEVARMMRQNDIRHLPIVDDQSRLVGMMTQRMLYQIRSPRKLMDGEWYYDEDILNDVILKNVMEKEVVSFQPYHSVGRALMKMTYSKCGGIPIVEDDNTLVGIVTRKDILKFAADIYQNKKL